MNKLWVWSPVDGSGEQFDTDNPYEAFEMAFGRDPRDIGLPVTLIGQNLWRVEAKTGKFILIGLDKNVA